MSRWSDERLTDDQVRGLNTPRTLAAIVTDQQFDHWYDPCGKSGDDLNPHLTRRSKIALERLRTACKLEEITGFHKDPKCIRRSNSLPFMIAALTANCSSGPMDAVARVAITRLKNYLWHGEVVEETVLDDIVEAVKEIN